MGCGAGRWSGALKSLLWGAVSRQGGKGSLRGFPSTGFLVSGIGGRRCCVEDGRKWWKGEGVEGGGHGGMDLDIVGAREARAGGSRQVGVRAGAEAAYLELTR